MRLAVIGCGSMGSLLAAYLSSQIEIVMMGHWQPQIRHLQESGLTLIHPDGQESFHTFPVYDNPTLVDQVDAALIVVKAYQTDRAAVDTASLLKKNGLAITLQNGLGNVEKLASKLGRERVTQGVTALGAMMVEPGTVRHSGFGATYLANLPGHQEILALISQSLNDVGFTTTISENIESLVWGKLTINAGINPLTAILRVPNGYLISNEAVKKIMIATVNEAAAVASALKIDLPFEDPAMRTIEVAQLTATNRSSMLQDVLRGSPTEIDFICGAVVRGGEKAGVPTPLNAEFLEILSSPDPRLAFSQSKIESIQKIKPYFEEGIA